MSEELDTRGITICTTDAGLVAGTTTTLTTGVLTNYAINGRAYAKAAFTNGASNATPTLDATTGATFVGVAANKASVFVVGFNAAGTLSISQGSVEDVDNTTLTGGDVPGVVTIPAFPDLPADFCAVGYLVVICNSAPSTWFPGTSNMAAVTGVNKTFVSVMTLPTTPQLN